MSFHVPEQYRLTHGPMGSDARMGNNGCYSSGAKMTWKYRDASHEKTPMLLGLVGPSGGGKTMSALRFATGVRNVTGADIVAMDTESRRMLRYAREFKFKYSEFGAPFSSLRYMEAIVEASKIGRIIIVDSMSHEHEGPGGYLEFHEREIDRMVGDNDTAGRRNSMNMPAWAKPAGDRRRLINTLLQLDFDALIFCFRSKEKVKAVKTQKEGRNVTEWVDAGWQAIAGDEFVYEMTTCCFLPSRSDGVPDWTAPPSKIEGHHKALWPAGEPISEETGERMAKWFQGAVATSAPAGVDIRAADYSELRAQGSEGSLKETFGRLWTDATEARDKERRAWLKEEYDKCLAAIQAANRRT